MAQVQVSNEKRNDLLSQIKNLGRVVCIDTMATVSDAARLMRENHVGDIVVVDNKGGKTVPVGIITDRDITIEICAQDVSSEKLVVGDVMTKPIEAGLESDDVFELVRKMKIHGVNRLPLVDREGSLAGLVSSRDLLKVLTQALDELVNLSEAQQQKERETRH